MLQDLYNSPKQLLVFKEFLSQLKFSKKCSRAIVSGMGGSAFPAEIARDYLDTDLVTNCRDYKLPSYADKKTLVIASSYSGNTEEVLSVIKESLKKDLPLIIITTGGVMLKMAIDKKIPHIQIPDDGIQPRLATGYILTAILVALHRASLCSDPQKDLKKTSKSIEKAFTKKTKFFNLAKKLEGQLPVIYAHPQLRTPAHIFKIKFNENSKHPAFDNQIPELNHNEMIGWTTSPVTPHFIILNDKHQHKRTTTRIEVFRRLMRKKKYPVTLIELEERSYLEKVFYILALADLVTIRFAQNRGVDPEPVPLVEEFKSLI
jgi:glucose/mannose-6-phosphate isomerase